MTKIKVSEASGAALDWMVASCKNTLGRYVQPNEKRGTTKWEVVPQALSYSNNWVHGGPIIEREITKLFKNVGGTYTAQIKREIPIRPEDRGTSLASHYIDWCNVAGPTPLIAAMRCYVASKLGDTVEVPEELV